MEDERLVYPEVEAIRRLEIARDVLNELMEDSRTTARDYGSAHDLVILLEARLRLAL